MNVHAIEDVLAQGVMLDAVLQSVSDGLGSPRRTADAPRKRPLKTRRFDGLLWVDYGSSSWDRVRPLKSHSITSTSLSRC